MTSDLTYPERAGKMSKSARKAACKTASKEWNAAKGDAISMMNHFRGVGEALNNAAGREQLLFNLEGFEFFEKELAQHLPKDLGIKQAKICINIRRHLKNPIQNWEELQSFKQEFQETFRGFELLTQNHRTELQSAHARNLFSDFVNRAAGMKLLFDELETEEPPERWSPAKLDEFLETTVPVAAMIEKVKALRLGIKTKTKKA